MGEPSHPQALKTFAVADRESFLAAIARHRRASWRVTAACAVAVAGIALVVAILMAPLLYCAIGLAFDVINLFTPAPDPLGWLGHRIDFVVNGKHVPWSAVAQLGAIAALPGLALMAVVTFGLRRIWVKSPLFDAGDIPGRSPDRTVFAEARLANVVEEMAIAAGIPVPRLVIVAGGVNAAAFGRDDRHVTLLVGEGMLDHDDREQLEGMIAHLVGSIADGDMTIGLRMTTTLALFGLLARFATPLDDREAFRETAKLWRVFVAPTSANTIALLGAIGDPFHDPKPSRPPVQQTRHSGSLTWREWLQMPFMGPLTITGFLGGLVSQMLLVPLIAAAWRQRKYMADAMAVQLTRDPDGLAGALTRTAESTHGIVAWTAHLAVTADSRRSGGPFGGSVVPIFPSPEKRIAALVRMGAHVTLTPKRRMPWPLALVLGVLLAIVFVLMSVVVYLLVIVSTALSGLFTMMPAAVLHVLLRWLAGPHS
jgi:Zn-dependent protease with chaperone function